MVKHLSIKDTIGILIKLDYYTLSSEIIPYWDIFWLQHPDYYIREQFSIIGEKWIKPFRNYRKSNKKVDKTQDTE